MNFWIMRRFTTTVLVGLLALSMALGTLGCGGKDDDGEQCSSCSTNSDCDSGLVCTQTTNFGRVCAPSSGSFSCPSLLP